MDTPIEISVLIPIYATRPEHAVWLREAVDSIKNQDYPLAEIIICDDSSRVEVPAWQDATLFRLPAHQGVCEARNFLAKQCQTPWLMFLDADDKLYEGILAKMAARASPDHVVYGDLMIFGNGHAQRYYALRDYDGRTMIEHPIMPVTTLHTKKAFEEVGGFDKAFEEGLEEWDYNIRLTVAGYCGIHLKEPMLWYRRHREQRSHGRNWLRGQRKKIEDRYMILKEADMPCCSGGSRRRAVPRNNPGEMSAMDLASGEMVLIEYTGRRMGAITLRGKATGTSYRFGGMHREKYVWPQDAVEILRLPNYRVVRPHHIRTDAPDRALLEVEAAQPAMPVPARVAPGVGRPSQPDQLSIIKGLGPRRIERLAEVGITRFEDLAAGEADDIAAYLNVSNSQAKMWVEEAQKLA